MWNIHIICFELIRLLWIVKLFLKESTIYSDGEGFFFYNYYYFFNERLAVDRM